MEIYAKKWNYWEFLKNMTPSVLSMVFLSLFTIADGFFVARGDGALALAAVNIVMPVLSICFGLGITLAMGGSAIVGIDLGQGKKKEADKKFTFIITTALVVSILTSFPVYIWLKEIVWLLGATDDLIDLCMDYLLILNFSVVFFILKICFEFFIRTDGRSDIALWSTIGGGIVNVILDYIFIIEFGMGIKGAAWGTLIGALFSVLIGLQYFLSTKSILKFRRFKFDFKFLTNVFVNGSSEMIGELSIGITTYIFNVTIIKYAAEAGIAAVSILLYVNFFIISLMIGLSMGIQPPVSYNFGAKNFTNIRNILFKSFVVTMLFSLVAFFAMNFFGIYIAELFIEGDDNILALTSNAMKLFSFAYLINGINIITSAFFTSVNNGKISAIISVSRTLIFVIIGITVLPIYFDIDGIWLAIPFAEAITMLFTVYFLMNNRKKYQLKAVS